jgi:hypothetical protein
VKQWLAALTEYVTVVIDTLALLAIVTGTAGAFLGALHLIFFPNTDSDRRSV